MSKLEQAALAVLKRWDSPQWDWESEGPTADLMADLRAAINASQASVTESLTVAPDDHFPGQPLTDHQIRGLLRESADFPALREHWPALKAFARAIEHAHGIGANA